MSVEGLHKLADELSGSTNPPFKEFGERIKAELEGVVDTIPAGELTEGDVATSEEVADALDEGGALPDEAPLPEEPPTEEPTDPEAPDLIRQDIEPTGTSVTPSAPEVGGESQDQCEGSWDGPPLERK